MRSLDPRDAGWQDMATYDEIYTQSWQEALKHCEKTLERHDKQRAMGVKSLPDFQRELDGLLSEYTDEQSRKAIRLILPTLCHYEEFAHNFVNMMARPVETSMMWGLLFLVFEVSLASTETGPLSPLSRITRWLEEIGHKLRTSNQCKDSITDVGKVKGDTVEVNTEIVILWLNIIMTFRNAEGHGDEDTAVGRLDENAWAALTAIYNSACNKIEEAVKRIEKVAELAERNTRKMNELTIMTRLLSLEERKGRQEVTLPCNTLPFAENRRFYGREDILAKLDEHLKPSDTSSSLSSIALYGLGGIGKTQTALAYAYRKLDVLDAVFWIPSEDTYSIQQAFSQIAVALKLPNSQPHAHQENMIKVLSWLQRTPAKWLLIFDNVDNHGVLDSSWPASQHGAVLVTTRDALVASLPIDRGLEVNEFDNADGARFLLHMATKRKRTEEEQEAAQKVATRLGGLPLALNQMSALIDARHYSINEFHAMYDKYDQELHKEKKSGWKYLGYHHALDTVWEISFESLGGNARACLGVLSFFSADQVPSEVFRAKKRGAAPPLLSFCEHDLRLDEALDELTHHALVRRNIEEDTFRVHRLVQSEYRARMNSPQEHFEAATQLLLEKFPSERSNQYDNEEWLLYERYIPQVIALTRNFVDSQAKPNPLKPTMDFVSLLTNAANAIHDNDTTNVVGWLLEEADSAYQKCPEGTRDKLLHAFLLSLKGMHYLITSDFVRSEREMLESIEIRRERLPPDDLLMALSYSWLSMAVASQGRYVEGLELLLKAGKILEGPAGRIPTRQLVWGYNTSRNYYCMGQYQEAEKLLSESLAEADGLESWYLQVYGHLTFTSLRTRMGQLDDAKQHIDKAKKLLETSGVTARFSWLSSYCAYRAGDVALRQGRYKDAIEEAERSTAIGKLVKVPLAILARCTHNFSKALKTDPSRQEEAERQRLEARNLRSQVPGGGGDLDDESDEAFESLIRMDHR